MQHSWTTIKYRNILNVGGAVAISILISTPAGGQTRPTPLPPAVKEYVASLDETCRDLGERPDRARAYIKRVDVTGDKIPDYVIDDGDYMCGATPHMLVGASGGAGNTVFAANAQGGATLAYDEFAGMGIRVGRSRAGHIAALVTVAQGCGATAKAGSCERPLIWNVSTRKMSFGPPQSPGQ